MIEPLACPVCGTRLSTLMAGRTRLHECDGCGGVWLDRAALKEVYAEPSRHGPLLAMRATKPSAAANDASRTRACPECRAPMRAVNFQGVSGVMVDACSAHGTWFDPDELRRTVEFVRAGGPEGVFERESAEWREARMRIEEQTREAAAGLPRRSRLAELGSDAADGLAGVARGVLWWLHPW